MAHFGAGLAATENVLSPLHVFRFHVSFRQDPLDGHGGGPVALCGGAFAECSGLEATMEPKALDAGGANYGAAQRAGRVHFATVVLRRGVTPTQDLWQWFQLVAGGGYAVRLSAEIAMLDRGGEPVVTWGLRRALPIKFKAADLDASGKEIGIEELQLVHEGLQLLRGG
jgi:phage tail-like protein